MKNEAIHEIADPRAMIRMLAVLLVLVAGNAALEAATGTEYILRPHRKNYILTTYSFEPNNPAALGLAEVEPSEVKFQISLRYDLFSFSNSRVTFAYTGLSFWQIYNGSESAPFRTTDHEPEIFWERDLDSDSRFRIGVVHESNGEGGGLSRSWNRLVGEMLWGGPGWDLWDQPFSASPSVQTGTNTWRVSAKVWWNFDYDEIHNPLIDEYLGAFELNGDLVRGPHQVSMMIRNSLGLFGDGRVRGATQIEYSFHITDGLRLAVQVFNGYGESLLDYDENIKRIGVGFQLSR